MKNILLLMVINGFIGLGMVFSPLTSSRQTSVHRALDIHSSASTHLVYLPLAYNNLDPSFTPLPAPDTKKIHGYAAISDLTHLPLEELNDYTNYIFSYHNYKSDIPGDEGLQALRQAGISVLLKLDRRIVEDSFDAAELKKLKSRLDNYKDVVYAICVIDEPYKPKKAYTEEQLRELVDKVKSIFPEYPLHVNFLAPYYVEEVTGEPFPNIPDNIDVISTDIYIHLEQTSGDEEYKMRVGRNLAIIMDRAHGRPVHYAAPAYGLVDDETTWPSVHQAQLDYELYVEYELDGLGWYFYGEERLGGDVWGASHWSEIIDKHKKIGQLILGDP